MATVAERIREGNDYVASHVYALESSTVRELYLAYTQAYREIQAATAQLFATLPDGKWSLSNVAAREVLMQQIARQMTILNQAEADITLASMLDGYQAGYYGTGWNLDTSVFTAVGANMNTLPLLPNEAIRAQVLAPYVGQTIGDQFRDNRSEFELKMKRSLVQSQIQGEGIYEAQKRIAEALGVQIGRRTNADRATNAAMFARTEMIARTELLRASNLGAQAVYDQNRDVLRGWEWMTGKDERVCSQCGPMDGKQYAFDDKSAPQPPPLHPRCRCTTVPVLLDQELERKIAGKRETYGEWAAKRGISGTGAARVYANRGKKAPVKEGA